MEFDHGKRVTPLLHELNILDAAIQSFSKKAKTFHDKKSRAAPINETPEERLAREAELAGALKHLETQRRLAETTVNVQAQVQMYQEKNRGAQGESRLDTRARIARLRAEKHHPTKTLAKFMLAVGRPQPSSKHVPHHVVPGKGRTAGAATTRINLHMLGIGINDPDNGVWLVHLKRDKGHWSMPDSKAHLELHTINYENWISRYVANAFLAGSKSLARSQLRHIRLLLQSGTQPKNVTMPPDPEWKGL